MNEEYKLCLFTDKTGTSLTTNLNDNLMEDISQKKLFLLISSAWYVSFLIERVKKLKIYTCLAFLPMQTVPSKNCLGTKTSS
jgi:hypothetical protein